MTTKENMNFKEFLEKKSFDESLDTCGNTKQPLIFVKDLFEFLWERGGKQFAIYWIPLWGTGEELYDEARCQIKKRGYDILKAQDFLDCVSIDENRVKELVEELKKK